MPPVDRLRYHPREQNRGDQHPRALQTHISLLDLCMPFLCKGHAILLCIVQIVSDEFHSVRGRLLEV